MEIKNKQRKIKKMRAKIRIKILNKMNKIFKIKKQKFIFLLTKLDCKIAQIIVMI